MGLRGASDYFMFGEICRTLNKEYERVVEEIATEKGNELGSRPSSPIYTDRSTMERKNSLGEIEGPTLVKRR